MLRIKNVKKKKNDNNIRYSGVRVSVFSVRDKIMLIYVFCAAL